MVIDGSDPLTVVYAGTPDFAVPALLQLHRDPHAEIVAVYTQPDRAAGRGRRTRASAVKMAAAKHAIPVLQPQKLNHAEAIEAFRSHHADLLVVAAYGLLIPQAILDAVSLPLNIHASLLPRWRGAAPIQHAIMAGDTDSGISIMRIVAALDAGPVVLQQRCAISRDETGGSLHDKLSTLGARCLSDALEAIRRDAYQETPQDELNAIYAPKITNADRGLDLHASALALERKIRALNPNPVATLRVAGLNLKIWSAHALAGEVNVSPGALIDSSKQGIDFATGDGILRITELQPEGKRVMRAIEFLNGYRDVLAQH